MTQSINIFLTQTYYNQITSQQMMGKQLTIVEQILEETNLQKAKQIFQQIENKQQLQQILSKLQEVLIYSNTFSKIHHRTFDLLLLEEIFAYSKIIKPESFKVHSIFQLIALTNGYMRSGFQKDKIRPHFIKNLKRDEDYWGLAQLQAFNNNLVDRSSGYKPIWSQSYHLQQIENLWYLVEFYETNSSLFPATFEIRNYLLKHIFMLRNSTDKQKQLYQRLTTLFKKSPYHYEILTKNIRFALQFFRNNFNEKETLYFPQKNIVNILAQYKNYEIQTMIIGKMSLGLTWNYEYLSNCIVNCIKLGINTNVSRIIKCFVQLGKNHQKYDDIIKVFQKNIGTLFIFMKHPNLFAPSFDLLKQFILGPPPSNGLYNSFIKKAINFVKLVSRDYYKNYLNFLEAVKQKYKQNTIVVELEKTIQQQIPNGYQQIDQARIKQILNQYDWKLFEKKQKETKINEVDKTNNKQYRGLVNIGNSCYMNSFIQCLFMTQELKRNILQASTLALEQTTLQKLKQQFKDNKNVQVPTLARQYVRPFAQFQRLLAQLQKSKRLAVNATNVKNTGPEDFRNLFQHDSIQYGRSLLQTITRSGFKHSFQGKMKIEIKCQVCQQKREKQEQFLDIMLNEQQEQVQYQNLEKMILKSLQPQVLSDLNCDNCQKVSKKSVKYHKISLFPDYLILTLKRFDYDPVEKKNKKKKYKVNIQEIVTVQNTKYETYAIIVHRGVSANSGHYFVFCKEKPGQNSRWVCFNDSDVSVLENFNAIREFAEISPQDTPYLIFLQKLEHIQAITNELQKPIILRAPLQNFIQKDNIQYVKNQQKKPQLFPLKNFNFNLFPKKDDSDDEDNFKGGFNGFGNNPII